MTPRPTGPTATIAAARWPEEGDPDRPPPVPGFTVTRLAPLVIRVAERCLNRAYPDGPPPPARALRTGLVLVSENGDTDNARSTARAVDARRRTSPLLFFQSVPNAALGHIAVAWGLGGPLVSTCPAGDPWAEAIDVAAGVIRSGDADDMLVIHAEPAPDAGGGCTAAALLVTLFPNGRRTTT
ncbi:hypothetical protein SUDANB121_05594 [Nocardiopsis dassonvillei]|uniref:beta-ketoacyl synthase N-terminal-like domain-containing protein n=1 Tax=Nocardiopsis dassonvillei TaxID=2014 RepID=UPI003F54DBE1